MNSELHGETDTLARPGVTRKQLKHELRTPINHIVGYADILLEDVADGHQRAQIARVREIGQELVHIVDELLSKAGGTDVETELFDRLRGRIRASVDLMSTMELERDAGLLGPEQARDLHRIIGAAARLRTFADTGQLRAQEASRQQR